MSIFIDLCYERKNNKKRKNWINSFNDKWKKCRAIIIKAAHSLTNFFRNVIWFMLNYAFEKQLIGLVACDIFLCAFKSFDLFFFLFLQRWFISNGLFMLVNSNAFLIKRKKFSHKKSCLIETCHTIAAVGSMAIRQYSSPKKKKLS